MQPKSPSPDFDFMLKEQPKRRGLPLSIPGISRPVAIVLGVLLFLILLIVIASAMSSRKTAKYQPFVGVLARGQETLRVTSYAQQLQLQDPQTQALAATVASALASDKQQVLAYLALNHDKVSSKAVAVDANKTTDVSLQSAAQNNGLDAAYVTYVRGALTKYESDVQAAYNTAGPNGKRLLSEIYNSVKTLLNSPPLKS